MLTEAVLLERALGVDGIRAAHPVQAAVVPVRPAPGGARQAGHRVR